jgi:antitoxin VapB
VRVRREGDKVILEPADAPAIDPDALWAELDALGGRDFMPEGLPYDPPISPDPRVFFDP